MKKEAKKIVTWELKNPAEPMVTLSQPTGTQFARRYSQMIVALYKHYGQTISKKKVFEMVTKAIDQSYKPSVSDHVYSLLSMVNIFQRKETFNELLTIGEQIGDDLIAEFERYGNVDFFTVQKIVERALELS